MDSYGIVVIVVLVVAFVAVAAKGRQTNATTNRLGGPDPGPAVNYERFTVKMPPLFTAMGIMLFAAGVVILFMYTQNPEKLATQTDYITYGAICALGLVFTFICLRWRVEFNGGTVTVTPPVGKKVTANYRDLSVQTSFWAVIVSVDGKRLFRAESTCSGYRTMMTRFERDGIPGASQ